MTESPQPQRQRHSAARHSAGRPSVLSAGSSRLSGWSAIVILAAIATFLFINAGRALREVGIWDMVSGVLWYPTSGENAQYGFLPSEVGSLWVTLRGAVHVRARWA